MFHSIAPHFLAGASFSAPPSEMGVVCFARVTWSFIDNNPKCDCNSVVGGTKTHKCGEFAMSLHKVVDYKKVVSF